MESRDDPSRLQLSILQLAAAPLADLASYLKWRWSRWYKHIKTLRKTKDTDTGRGVQKCPYSAALVRGSLGSTDQERVFRQKCNMDFSLAFAEGMRCVKAQNSESDHCAPVSRQENGIRFRKAIEHPNEGKQQEPSPHLKRCAAVALARCWIARIHFSREIWQGLEKSFSTLE